MLSLVPEIELLKAMCYESGFISTVTTPHNICNCLCAKLFLLELLTIFTNKHCTHMLMTAVFLVYCSSRLLLADHLAHF